MNTHLAPPALPTRLDAFPFGNSANLGYPARNRNLCKSEVQLAFCTSRLSLLSAMVIRRIAQNWFHPSLRVFCCGLWFVAGWKARNRACAQARKGGIRKDLPEGLTRRECDPSPPAPALLPLRPRGSMALHVGGPRSVASILGRSQFGGTRSVASASRNLSKFSLKGAVYCFGCL